MTVYPRGNGFEVCVTLPGGHRIREAAKTRQQAHLIEIQIRSQLPAPKVSDIGVSVSFKTLLEACKLDWQSERKVRSFDSFYKSYCVTLEAYFGAMDIRAITKETVKKFKAWREKNVNLNQKGRRPGQTAAPGTVGNSLKVLRRVFNFAIEAGMLDRNPVKGVKIPECESRDKFGTVPQQNKLLHEVGCPDKSDPSPVTALDFQDFVFCMFRTGIRSGFLKKIRVGDVDPGRPLVTIKRTKKGKPWTVRLLPLVWELFKRRSVGLKLDDLLLTNCGQPWGKFYKRWYSACRRAGLTDFRPHDCRHTFASDLRAAGVPMDRIMPFLDHSNYKTTERYAHLGDDFLKGEVEKYENHLKDCGAFVPQLGERRANEQPNLIDNLGQIA